MAGRQVIRRAPHEHAVHVVESVRRHALVRDAVLGAEDGKRPRRNRGEGVERVFGVLRLGGQQQDVIAGPGNCGRAVNDRNAQRDGFVGRFEAKPVVSNGLVVCASCNEHDVVTMLREPPTDTIRRSHPRLEQRNAWR